MVYSTKHVESSLKRAIGQYARNNRWIYIGLTQQNPRNRFSQHQRLWAPGHKWDQMIVIHRSKTLRTMHRVEEQLILYARDQAKSGKYKSRVVNKKLSGLPYRANNPDGYWVYILVQR